MQVVLFWLQQLLKVMQASKQAVLSVWPDLATNLVTMQSLAAAFR